MGYWRDDVRGPGGYTSLTLYGFASACVDTVRFIVCFVRFCFDPKRTVDDGSNNEYFRG